jgi:hypothetical protein
VFFWYVIICKGMIPFYSISHKISSSTMMVLHRFQREVYGSHQSFSPKNFICELTNYYQSYFYLLTRKWKPSLFFLFIIIFFTIISQKKELIQTIIIWNYNKFEIKIEGRHF